MSAYDDGSEVEVTTPVEDQPRSGVWVDAEDVIHDRTEEDEELGRLFGEAIDVDDDEDNGSGLFP